MADQVKQALQNILAVLAEAQGGPEHIVRLTWYVTSRDEYLRELKEIGEAYRAVMGTHYPRDERRAGRGADGSAKRKSRSKPPP